MTTLLQVSGLNKNFGGVTATDDVTFDVRRGEIHAIIGPNGAGKTTLIAQLSGALKPDSGTITLNGADITKKAAYKRARLGITRSFQITSLVMEMSVLENVSLAVQAGQGHSFRFIAPARASVPIRNTSLQHLGRVGLAERAGMRTGNLSHGEHRQLEIAVALAAGSELMLLDEPMAGLGAEESRQLVGILKTLMGERTILLVEHDMDAVFALADRISVLVYGRIIATGTPNEIREDSAVRHAYLGEE